MAERICSVPDCDRPIGRKGARGWCNKHYQRWLAHGDPEICLRPNAGRWLPTTVPRTCSVEDCTRPAFGDRKSVV